MGEKRDLRRNMEKEVKKGSFPLEFDRLELDKDSYHVVDSVSKLEDIFDYLFRMGKYKSYEGITVINNIYMDYDIILNQCYMKRLRTVLDRLELRSKMLYRARRLKPDYAAGKVILESIKCFFKVDQEQLDKYKMKRKEMDTYGFPMSTKYMIGLYLLCEEARKSLSKQMIEQAEIGEQFKKVARLENVKNGIFKSLLLDDIHYQDGAFVANMVSILIIE